MTAEIAVMNQSAVALAADSAATLSREKILVANKIFALSKYEPIAIMIYGGASCMMVPWETTIKEYRARLGDTSHPTVEAYAKDFLRFIGRNKPLFPGPMQAEFASQFAGSRLAGIVQEIGDRASEKMSGSGAITTQEVRRIVREIVVTSRAAWRSAAPRPGLPPPKEYRRRLQEQYKEQLEHLIEESFQNLPMTKTTRSQLVEITLDVWCKAPRAPIPTGSGIVIAGFGSKEMFPALVSYQIDGVILDHPVCRQLSAAAMGHETAAYISPFAQEDMIRLFMEGVTPEYEAVIETYLQKILVGIGGLATESVSNKQVTPAFQKGLVKWCEEMQSTFRRDLSAQRHALYSEPILRIVANLPMDELASLAASLVNLTSLRRRMSPDQETVGGPIDVAVISRGDGLIWIDRKHYFEPERNPQFFTNYYKRR